VDIVLSGHDHQLMSYYNGKVALLESGSQGDFVTVLEIQVERGAKGLTWRPEIRTIPTADVAPDPAMAGHVKPYLDRLSEELNQPIGRTGTELDSRRNVVRGGEAAIGNLIADALRDRAGADVALINGGGIHAERRYDPGTSLTRGDILREMPYGNKLVTLEVTGAQILAALENGVSEVQQTAGRFPQVSGMSFLYDPRAEPGKRIRDIKIGEQPIDLKKSYTLATNDFLADGGDGYGVLRQGRVLVGANLAPPAPAAVIDYVEARGTVEPRTEGRIRTAN
jgi:2',3'-cyclic-nucleotide 2'-phosphodiesterase (5'-nucleotidase family)